MENSKKSIFFIPSDKDRADKIINPLKKTNIRLEVFYPDYNKTKFKTLDIVINLLRNMESNLILTDDVYSSAGLAYYASRCLGIPYSIRLRGDPWAEYKLEYFLRTNIKGISQIEINYDKMNKYVRNAKYVLPVSAYLGTQIEKNVANFHGRWKKLHIPLNPHFNDRPIQQDFIDRFNLGGKRIILSVTHFTFMEKVKPIINFLPFMEKLCGEFKDLCWVIAGDGYHRHFFLNKLKEFNINVLFTGKISNIRSAYKASEIFLHLSGLDAFPCVIIEAQAAGCPTVTSQVGGIPEQILNGKTGFMIDKNDMESFYLTIKKLLLDQDLRYNIGKSAVDFVESNYTVDALSEQFREVFNEII